MVWSGWRPELRAARLLPPRSQAFFEMLTGAPRFWSSLVTTMTQGRSSGFALALLIGTIIGILTARIRPLRLAVGSLITGLQTMPSIAWFPLAILLFGINESGDSCSSSILGAAPSIANGVISGIDNVPPSFSAVGQGARGRSRCSCTATSSCPRPCPPTSSGLTQGWAFAWRSLMAGELLVIIAEKPSLGSSLEFFRQLNKTPELLATMLAILIIGMIVDGVFSSAARKLRQRRGLAT
ncbi:MAG: hypothetical protein V9G10_14100 [Candidatus Nanopelagicales bacterium]